MTIETNMPSRPVQVTLPLRDVKVPTEAVARQRFLEQLAVFIEHSDGEKKWSFLKSSQWQRVSLVYASL